MTSDHDALLREAIEALQKAENLLAKIDRGGLLTKLDELREAIESFPQVQLDMRIARMRLTASLSDDPDKTPLPRNISSTLIRAAVPPKPEKP